jgi:glycerol-3-phosphate dehydrogenase
MKRDLVELTRRTYDLLVIGGGIYGSCVAWDALLRGLSVALVEKGDFGHATSSNTLRIIHGGLRYLQHGDISRMRQSMFERSTFMRIAPHLVHPLPFLIPTYGHLTRGKEIFSLAVLINNLLVSGRDRLEDPQKHLPHSRVISREECLDVFPGINDMGLTGAAVVHDCQMYCSERLVLSFVRSSFKSGASVANYVEVNGLIEQAGRVVGIRARDILNGEALEVRAKIVVNTSGPWQTRVLGLLNGRRPRRRQPLSKAFNLLLNRQIIPNYAVGIYSKGGFKDRDAVLNKGSRLFFITPWRGRSLIGTVHLPYDCDPDQIMVKESEIGAFLNEINEACPTLDLKRRDISFAYVGLLPSAASGANPAQLLKRYQIYDHDREDGIRGLISVTGVKFTEARHVAEKTVDLVFSKLGQKVPRSTTAKTRLHGGQIEQFQSFLKQESQRQRRDLSPKAIEGLIYRYGSAYSEVLKYRDDLTERARPTNRACVAHDPIVDANHSSLNNAEILYAVREEMAQKLADVIFRRTELGLAGNPGEKCVKRCAKIMSKELGWNANRTQNEIDEVGSVLARRNVIQ